jgi:hypothetical protein
MAGGDLTHPIHNVVTRGKGAPTAGDHHNPDIIVTVAFFREIDKTFDHLPGDGIEALGPVEGHGGNAALAMKAESCNISH